MGTFSVLLEVSNPFTGAATVVDALVDSGSTYSAMPASLLQGLGIEPFETRTLRIASGEAVQYETGVAGFATEGRYGIARVIFGPEGQYLMGATTLEDLALVIDLIEERLAPNEGLLLTFTRSI